MYDDVDIKEASRFISEFYNKKYLELKDELTNRINVDIEATAKLLRLAILDGDLRENASYADASEKLSKLNGEKLGIVNDILNYEKNIIGKDTKYVYTGYINVFTCFRLKDIINGDISTWKVFPGKASDIGILSVESEVYKQLYNKQVGDEIERVHRITGKVHRWKIIEIY